MKKQVITAAQQTKKNAERNEKRKFQRQVVRVLTDARKLLEEKGWTRGALARNKARKVVAIEDPGACYFCTIGAIQRAWTDSRYSHNIWMEAEKQVESIITSQYSNLMLEEVNDKRSTKKEHILMAFDLAILGAGK